MNWKRARVLGLVILVQLALSGGVFALYWAFATPDPFNIFIVPIFVLVSIVSAGQVSFVNTALAGQSVEKCPTLAVACAAAVPPFQATLVEASNMLFRWLDSLGVDLEGGIGWGLVVLPIIVPIGVHFIAFRLLASRAIRVRSSRQCLECGFPRAGREGSNICPECGHLHRTWPQRHK